MPRKSSPVQSPKPTQPAQPAQPAPSVTPSQPSLASTILQGFSFGAGQSLAFNLFRSDPKETKETKETVKETKETKEVKEPKEPVKPKTLSECIKDEECNKLLETFLNKEFIKCMKDNNYEDCKYLI